MNKWKIFPGIIILIQLISLGHLYYTYQYENSEIPATFINIIMLVLSYFFYFKADKNIFCGGCLYLYLLLLLFLL